MTLEDEIDKAVQLLRQQHEIEVGKCERLEQFMEAHNADLIERIRGMRHREAFRRSEAAKELVALASEIGLIPRQAPQPEAIDTDAPMRMPNCIARHPAQEALDDVVLQ